MIIDTIENYKIYTNIHQRFEQAFDYILHTNFAQIESGKYSIDGDNIFALVQEYDTKPEGKLESHYTYIDIQFVVSGTELIGTAVLKNQTLLIENIEKDIVFYDGLASYITMEAGMFAIFFPQDLHMPCIMHKAPEKVKKVVVKVRL